MVIADTFISQHSCSYLPNRDASLEYVLVEKISAEEYNYLMINGWRRFGHSLFKPKCQTCHACESLRIIVKDFKPNRSQKRAWKTNLDVELRIKTPHVTYEKLDLYNKYHFFQSFHRDWPDRGNRTEHEYAVSFTENPFKTEEWCYYLDDKLIALGYVDALEGGVIGNLFLLRS